MGMKATGTMHVAIPVEVISVSRGKVVVRVDGDTKTAFAGDTIMVSADVIVSPW